jgi:predicted metal-dependent TIM-barrel fold hydrolase
MIVDMLKGDPRVKPHRVCVDHVEEHTVRLALDNGFWCGMTLYPVTKVHPGPGVRHHRDGGHGADHGELGGRLGKSDPLAVPELIQEMRRRGHREADIRKVVYDNPLSFWRQANNWREWPPEAGADGVALQKAKAGY